MFYQTDKDSESFGRKIFGRKTFDRQSNEIDLTIDQLVYCRPNERAM